MLPATGGSVGLRNPEDELWLREQMKLQFRFNDVWHRLKPKILRGVFHGTGLRIQSDPIRSSPIQSDPVKIQYRSSTDPVRGPAGGRQNLVNPVLIQCRSSPNPVPIQCNPVKNPVLYQKIQSNLARYGSHDKMF